MSVIYLQTNTTNHGGNMQQQAIEKIRAKTGVKPFVAKRVMMSLDKHQLKKLDEFKKTPEGRRYRYDSMLIAALFEDQLDYRMKRKSRLEDRLGEPNSTRGQSFGYANTVSRLSVA